MHSFGMICIRISDQDLYESWCFKGTGGSVTRVDSPVPLMHHDPDRSWVTDPDPDHPKGTYPNAALFSRVTETSDLYICI